MALVVKDRVKETTTTAGNGTVTLDGAVSGYQSFSVIGDGNTTYYAIVGPTEWEVGIGTYTLSGTTLSRDTVLESSNSGSKVVFSAGTKDVFVTYPAERSVYVDGTSITPATSATLPISSGGTGATTLAAANIPTTNSSNTFTAAQTFQAASAVRSEAASTQDAVVLAGRAGGTNSYAVTITPTTLTASRTATFPDSNTNIPISAQTLTFSGPTAARTYTLPDSNSTLAALGTAQTFTAVQTLTDPAIIGTILEDVYTISDGAAFEIDPGNGSIQLITLGASRTPKATNFSAGEAITLMVDDGSAYTITWTDATFGGSGVVWETDNGSAPTLSTSGYTTIVLWKVSTQVYGARVGNV